MDKFKQVYRAILVDIILYQLEAKANDNVSVIYLKMLI